MRVFLATCETTELFLGAIDESADGSNRDLKNVTDFLVAFFFEKCEHENGLIFLWEFGDH